MDKFLEKWVGKQVESVEQNGLNSKVQGELGKTLAETPKNAAEEGSIEQMIGDIDNERIRNILEHYLKEKLRTKEEIMGEIAIYYNEIEPRLGDEKLNELFNLLINKKRILPSSILEEFQIRDQILNEPNLEARKLMEISLAHKKFPSMVLNGKNIYQKLAGVEDEEAKNLILYCLEGGLSPEGVDDEYEDYIYIKNYEFKNNDLRDFVLSLIYSKKANPSLVAFFFDIFKDWTEFGEDDKKYIIGLINTRGL